MEGAHRGVVPRDGRAQAAGRAALQARMVPAAETTVAPSGVQATARSGSPCSRMVVRSRPSGIDHSFTERSSETDASVRPSGANARPRTAPTCPSSVASGRASGIDHSFMESPCADASIRPSGASASAATGSAETVGTSASPWPSRTDHSFSPPRASPDASRAPSDCSAIAVTAAPCGSTAPAAVKARDGGSGSPTAWTTISPVPAPARGLEPVAASHRPSRESATFTDAAGVGIRASSRPSGTEYSRASP